MLIQYIFMRISIYDACQNVNCVILSGVTHNLKGVRLKVTKVSNVGDCGILDAGDWGKEIRKMGD